MKGKPKETKKLSNSQRKSQNKSSEIEENQQQDRTFSDWLRSEEGIENLKLFVLGNTILVFTVISWPHIKETLDAVYYLYLDYTQNK